MSCEASIKADARTERPVVFQSSGIADIAGGDYRGSQDFRQEAGIRSVPILTDASILAVLHRPAHAADAPRHRAHDVERKVRHFVDHKAELALIDDRELDRLLDARGR